MQTLAPPKILLGPLVELVDHVGAHRLLPLATGAAPDELALGRVIAVGPARPYPLDAHLTIKRRVQLHPLEAQVLAERLHLICAQCFSQEFGGAPYHRRQILQ